MSHDSPVRDGDIHVSQSQQLLVYTSNLPVSLIGMEAGVGSHFLGRALREQGHEVRLIPAQFVRPFVKSNKTYAFPLPLHAGQSGSTSQLAMPAFSPNLGWATPSRR